MKSKTIVCSIVLVLFSSYLLYRVALPTEIIGVHQWDDLTRIVVKNFPLSAKGKIEWWIKNRTYLKSKYSTPIPNAENGNFTVSIWDIGDGYRANRLTDEDSDLLCFKDIKSNANCIEKKRLMFISRYHSPWSGDIVIDYTVNNQTYRQRGENGEIKRVKDEE